jgi:hypothetical protein
VPIRIRTGENLLGTRSTTSSSGRTRLRDDAADGLVASIRHAIIAFGPWAPRSVLAPAPEPVVAQGSAGQLVRIVLTVRNLQSALVVVSPALTMFRRADGGTWSPDHALRSTSRLLWPGESTTIDLAVSVAARVPAGIYDGSIRCLATTGMVPVRVIIRESSERQ